jgi:hypothetical protein
VSPKAKKSYLPNSRKPLTTVPSDQTATTDGIQQTPANRKLEPAPSFSATVSTPKISHIQPHFRPPREANGEPNQGFQKQTAKVEPSVLLTSIFALRTPWTSQKPSTAWLKSNSSLFFLTNLLSYLARTYFLEPAPNFRPPCCSSSTNVWPRP